jgi:hypothetical protein
MADIIEVILADHKRIRGMPGALDYAARYGEDPCAGWMLAPEWCRLSDLLELHAEAEEGDLLSGPVRAGQDATAQMQDAIADHDDFREELRKASARRRFCDLVARVASVLWASSGHVAREERGALAVSAAAPPRRYAMSLAASGPRSSPPALVTQQQKRESATTWPGEPGQARPVIAPFTTHPEIVLPFLGG